MTKRYEYFEVIDFDGLVEDYSTSSITDGTDSCRCYCPYCTQHGEPNSKVSITAYFNSKTIYCFRCKTFGIDKSMLLSKPDRLLNKEKRRLSQLTEPEDLIYPGMKINHLKEISSPKYLDYFSKHRSTDYLKLVNKLNWKEIRFLGRDGVFVPFYLHGKIVSYQIRYIDNRQPKCYTSEGSPKIPYILSGKSSKTDVITLVEGIFDSVGAYYLGLPNPVAINGGSLSHLVKDIIVRILRPRTIIYAMDSRKFNIDVITDMSNYYHEWLVIDFDDIDPDESYIRGLRKDDLKFIRMNTPESDKYLYNKTNNTESRLRRLLDGLS